MILHNAACCCRRRDLLPLLVEQRVFKTLLHHALPEVLAAACCCSVLCLPLYAAVAADWSWVLLLQLSVKLSDLGVSVEALTTQ